MTQILVASPVRQKPNILKEFLASLKGLETGRELELTFGFIDDNGEESKLLKDFATGKDNVWIFPGDGEDDYHCDENTHHWKDHLTKKVGAYKDFLINLAREKDFDYLFLVDSDLVLHPHTLVHLVSLDKDIVSEVFWTKWFPEQPPLPQVWIANEYRLHRVEPGENLTEEEMGRRITEFLAMLRRPGTYKVGGLGACTLISRKALLRGVSFAPIYNLDFVGEDRHFCIRAAALGLELYADTHYPPYHIYRESELAGLQAYFASRFPAGGHPGRVNNPAREELPGRKGGITLAMLVRNEEGRYLAKVLEHAARYVDRTVIVDDASEDGTVEICRQSLASVPLRLVSNPSPSFNNEAVLRQQLWQMAVETSPDWILILDADEIFEDRAVQEIPRLAAETQVDVWAFRLYDMWDDDHYREDGYWKAHRYYRPFMVRYLPDFNYQWRETPQHCGRLPCNIDKLRVATSNLRIKHLGWIRPADRLAKYHRYQQLDPGARYGILEQYLSILDPKPNLVRWDSE